MMEEEKLAAESDEKETLLFSQLETLLDEFFLSKFQKVMTLHFLREQFALKEGKDFDRVKEWIFLKLNGKGPSNYALPLQYGCPEIIPKLTASTFWYCKKSQFRQVLYRDSSRFPWISKFEEQFDLIRAELLNLRDQKGFQPYRGPTWTSKLKAEDGIGALSHDSGEWNVFYLFLHEMKFNENCKKVPKTVELIEKFIPRQYHHAFFSAVAPGTHIMRHHGPTNKKLRFHIPLIGTKGSKMRVGNDMVYLEERKCYVFDDSFEHEAWHEGDQTRILLIIDFWHPDLSDEEVRFLTLLRNTKLRFEKKISDDHPDKDNFFSIIESSKSLLTSNDWWKIK